MTIRTLVIPSLLQFLTVKVFCIHYVTYSLQRPCRVCNYCPQFTNKRHQDWILLTSIWLRLKSFLTTKAWLLLQNPTQSLLKTCNFSLSIHYAHQDIILGLALCTSTGFWFHISEMIHWIFHLLEGAWYLTYLLGVWCPQRAEYICCHISEGWLNIISHARLLGKVTVWIVLYKCDNALSSGFLAWTSRMSFYVESVVGEGGAF